MKLENLLLNHNVPIPDKEKKLTEIFIFTLLCGASKGFMNALKTFIKPFEARQRSVKIKIQLNFFSSSGIGTGRVKKLQDMSRNRRFLINEVEKIARLPQMPKVTASTLRYFSYIFSSYSMYVTQSWITFYHY